MNRIRKTMEYTNRQDEPYKKNHEIYKLYQNNSEIQTDKINCVRKTMKYTNREIQTEKKNIKYTNRRTTVKYKLTRMTV